MALDVLWLSQARESLLVAFVLGAVTAGCAGLHVSHPGYPSCGPHPSGSWSAYQLEALGDTERDGDVVVAFRLKGSHDSPVCPWEVVQVATVTLLLDGAEVETANVVDGVFRLHASMAYPAILRSEGVFSIVVHPGEYKIRTPVASFHRYAQRRRDADAEAARKEQARKEAERSAQAAQEAERTTREAREWVLRRLEELSFRDWSGYCRRHEILMDGACSYIDDSYARGTCDEIQRQAMKQKYVFFLGNVHRGIRYDGSKKEFLVEIPRLLAGSVDFDRCARGGCAARMVSADAFRVREGEATFDVWWKRISSQLLKSLEPKWRFKVPVDLIETPLGFDDAVIVDALVVVKSRQSVVVDDWFDFRNIHVDVVAIRAYLPDLSWGKVVVAPDRSVERFECPEPLLLPEGEE